MKTLACGILSVILMSGVAEAQELTHLPHQTRILVWNTYKGSLTDFQRDAQELIDQHDLVLFQEVIFNSFYEELLSQNGEYGLKLAKSWGENGVATSSKSQANKHIPLKTEVRELVFFTPKASLITYYNIKDAQGQEQKLMVLNVHMINFRASKGFKKHLEQFRPYLEEHEGPIVAAGDFNTWSPFREKAAQEFFAEFEISEVALDHPSAQGYKSIFGVLDRAYSRGLNIQKSYVYDEISSSDHKPFSLIVTVP